MAEKLVAVFLIYVFVVAAVQIREAEATFGRQGRQYLDVCLDRCASILKRDFCYVFCVMRKEKHGADNEDIAAKLKEYQEKLDGKRT
ncbi:hypothetical protein ABKV19_018411 [Rosa sericea]